MDIRKQAVLEYQPQLSVVFENKKRNDKGSSNDK